MTRLTTAQRTAAYGPPGDRNALVTVTTPWGVRTSCHRAVQGAFIAACNRAKSRSRWTPQRIDSFNPRPIRGSSDWSLHSWALAWDFFATPPNVPPPGGVWTPHNGVPVDFATAFTEAGFTWGATFSRKDVPHIEWAGPPPGPGQEDVMTPEQEAKIGGWLQDIEGRIVKKVNDKAAADRKVLVDDLNEIKADLAEIKAKIG